jgi:hypothetical protein
MRILSHRQVAWGFASKASGESAGRETPTYTVKFDMAREDNEFTDDNCEMGLISI